MTRGFVLKFHTIDTKERTGFVTIECIKWFGGYIILIFSVELVWFGFDRSPLNLLLLQN